MLNGLLKTKINLKQATNQRRFIANSNAPYLAKRLLIIEIVFF